MLFSSEYTLQCTVSFTIIYTVAEINLERNLQSISWYILNGHKVVINFDLSLRAYKLFYNLFWASSPMYCLGFIQVWKKHDWSQIHWHPFIDHQVQLYIWKPVNNSWSAHLIDPVPCFCIIQKPINKGLWVFKVEL